ncbi:MAG: dTDP-4-dehydrorhamnose 3,5-epimerase family protein [Caulobacterales bacterium]
MRFETAPLPGVTIIHPTRHADDRGFFQRTYCRDTFLAEGLEECAAQSSISFNARAGTLRGMHYQAEPHGEAKLVRASRGAVHDIIVDVRPGSKTFGRSFGIELSARNGVSLYIPRGCAHGFITLADETEVTYSMSAPFAPEAARGFRYNDPVFALTWPTPVVVISDKELAWPLFTEQAM